MAEPHELVMVESVATFRAFSEMTSEMRVGLQVVAVEHSTEMYTSTAAQVETGGKVAAVASRLAQTRQGLTEPTEWPTPVGVVVRQLQMGVPPMAWVEKEAPA
jgi:hypothetical protein